MDVHPLIFEPIFKARPWGGRALEQVLGKRLPTGERIGESWEAADLDKDVSVVRSGPSKGRTLHDLVEAWGAHLTGRAALPNGRFPLLLKFLDAREALSIQVHPSPGADASADSPLGVKHEAWIVLAASPEACIYRGLRAGLDMEDLRAALGQQRIESVLQRLAVKPGQAFFVPAGVVHALGAGVLVAEVQTPSDVTYRLYDWARLDDRTGLARELHIEAALRCLVAPTGLAEAETRSHVASVWTSVTRLVTCASFIVERVRMVDGVEQEIPYDELVVWMVLSGRGEIGCRWGTERLITPFTRGDTIVLPAGMKEGRVRTEDDCAWLEITVPIRSDLSSFPRVPREALRGLSAEPSPLVGLGLPRRDSDGSAPS